MNAFRVPLPAPNSAITYLAIILGALAFMLLGGVALAQRWSRRCTRATLYRLERVSRVFGLTPGLSHGMDGLITSWSDLAKRTYGYPSAKVLGQHGHRPLRSLVEIEREVRRGHWRGELAHSCADGKQAFLPATGRCILARRARRMQSSRWYSHF